MIIHKTRPGETALSVAKKYGADAEAVARDNGIYPRERLAAGRELLILPRRRDGENPGAGLALSLLIGYFYPGCRPEEGATDRVRAALLSEYVIRRGGISRAGSCFAARREAAAHGADIFSRYFLRELPEGDAAEKLARVIADSSLSRSERGVALGGISAHAGAEEFLLTLKRECMARDLALIAELTPEMTGLSSVPDIVVLTPDETAGAGEVCRAMADFAERTASSVVIDITPLTLSGGRGMTAEEAVREADRRGGRVETDGETLLSRVSTGRQSALFPSLEFICRVAREAERLGWCGLSVDGCRAGAPRLTLAAHLCSGSRGYI